MTPHTEHTGKLIGGCADCWLRATPEQRLVAEHNRARLLNALTTVQTIGAKFRNTRG